MRRIALVSADGMPERRLHAADADEAAYAVQYELDLIMSETGRDLDTRHAFGEDS